MSIETGVLLDASGQALYWHFPPGRNSVQLPDSRDLWDVIWKNRENISGFAHSHPGYGAVFPSWEDTTTFSAVERALNFRLDWFIINKDQVIVVNYNGLEEQPYTYKNKMLGKSQFPWLNELRFHSYKEHEGAKNE